MVHHFASLGSTQDVAHELAERGAPTGTAVVADELTAGRGSRGRQWHAPRGGLWLSLIYRPAAPPTLSLLSIQVGLAVAGVLERALGVAGVRLKWPNDLMLGDRKAGGILCEARWQGAEPAWVVVGLGLNVSNPLAPEITATAARLADQVPGLSPADVLGPVLAGLRSIPVDRSTLSDEDLAAFEARDWLRGRRLAEPETGRAAGIDAEGSLRVERPSGRIVTVRTGSIVLAA
ncbi:MAG: biotin--[acetyl-CoA-carboxylase] ligase [Gemmatimonadota bacterium]